MKSLRRCGFVIVSCAFLVLTISLAGAPQEAAAQSMTLKISHQWPGGTIDQGDFRDRLCRLFAKEVEEKTKGAITFEIHASSALFKAVPQYDAMLRGALDMSVFPLDYASGKVPQFSITLMPCIVEDQTQAMGWKDKPIGKEIEKICENAGIRIITWAWCAGGLATKNKPVILPQDIKGMKIRAAGKMFETMLHTAGAAITSMPSSEIYFALQTGILDACVTSSSSFYSYRLYEQVKYYTSPRNYTFWFMLEPLVMSMKTWNRLSPEYQKIVSKVGKDLEKFTLKETISDDARVADYFKEQGVTVHDMTKEELKAWTQIAKESAWKTYAAKVKDGQKLLDMAIAAK
jgi:TRAP-type C4-dicarboxylate transport system substrate-binding protein